VIRAENRLVRKGDVLTKYTHGTTPLKEARTITAEPVDSPWRKV
jgi:hypothetical protein